MTRKELSPAGSTTQGLSDPRYLSEKFTPGQWLERRQVEVPSCTAISGCYERQVPVAGGFHSDKVHFYELSLAGRAPDAKGRLVECFREPQPLGDVLFVPAGHRYAGASGLGTQRKLFVFLNATSLMAENASAGDVPGTPRMQDFMNLRSDRIRFILRQISLEMHNPGFASELMIEGLATTLLAETARLLKQASDRCSTRGGLAPATLRKVRDRVLEGEKPPTLVELAELCNLSRRHLMRAFRESTGQTVGQFIQQVIVEKAIYLLRETDKPVGLIASELGFVNTSAFSTAFRRLTGESPRDFRSQESTFVSLLGDYR